MANRVRITLTGEGGDAEQALRGVENRLERVQRQSRKTSRGMEGVNRVSSTMVSRMQGLAGAAGVAAGAAGMGYLVNQSLTAQEELLNLHKTTGIAIERIQEYQFAARKSGVAQSQINDALSEMSQRMGEAVADFQRTGGEVTEMGEGFQAAGISMQELQRLDPTQVFDRLSTSIQQAKDEQTALNIAAKAFGDESGRAMVAMLREGDTAIGEYINQAHELGIILDEDVVRKGAEAKKSITTLTVALESQFNRVVGNLAPIISDLADDTADWISENDKLLEQELPEHFEAMAQGLAATARAIGWVIEGTANVSEGLAAAAYGSDTVTVEGQLKERLADLRGGLQDVTGKIEEYKQVQQGAGELTSKQEEALERLQRREAELAKQISNTSKTLRQEQRVMGDVTEADRMLWEEMARTNEQADQGTDKARERIRIFESEATSTEALARRYRELYLWMDDMTKLDLERSKMTPPSAVGPGGAGADDEWAKQAARQREATRGMAPPNVRFSTLEGGADDEWARKQMENMNQVGEEAKSTADVMENAFDGWASKFGSQLTDMVWEAEFSFDRILEAFGKMVTQMIIQQQLIKPMVGAATGEGGWIQGLFGSAQGNVFQGGHHLQQYAKGGVVDRPTLFPMANGAGLMGEAGPEAVMPLKRTRGGDLGVKSEGRGGATQVEVNVINQSGQPVEAEEEGRRFDGKKMILDVVLNAASNNENGFGRNLKGTLRKY